MYKARIGAYICYFVPFGVFMDIFENIQATFDHFVPR